MKKYVPHLCVLASGVLWGLIGIFNRRLTAAGLSVGSIVLIRKAYPGLSSYSLQFLRQALGLGEELDEARPHRAGYDAELTMEAFSMAMKTLYSRAE